MHHARRQHCGQSRRAAVTLPLLQEGWTPATFKSSRGSRADAAQQRVSDFLDEDERAELEAKGLQAASGYDTFAAQSEAVAKGQAEREAAGRHGEAAAGLTLFPAEALKPAQLSIGMRLLQKMGWHPVRTVEALSSCVRLYRAVRGGSIAEPQTCMMHDEMT